LEELSLGAEQTTESTMVATSEKLIESFVQGERHGIIGYVVSYVDIFKQPHTEYIRFKLSNRGVIDSAGNLQMSTSPCAPNFTYSEQGEEAGDAGAP